MEIYFCIQDFGVNFVRSTLGSAPGLLVGMGLGSGHSLWLTLTQMEEGKLSSCSHEVSSSENRMSSCVR